jgi:hypothetical protein
MSIVAGIVRVNGVRAPGRTVRAHDRTNGELIGTSVTNADGVYSIDVGPYGDNCYVVALPLESPGEIPSYNATILDQFSDIEDELFLMTESNEAVMTEDDEFILIDQVDP